MTQEAAIQAFFSSFGIPAYAAASVPDRAEFPYITYNVILGDWEGGELMMPVNVWYRTESEAAPNAKVREIHARIGDGGTMLRCDGGMLWLKRGSPWSQAVTVEGEDAKVKRRYVNVDVEYLTIG